MADALLHGARLVHFISQKEKRTKCKLPLPTVELLCLYNMNSKYIYMMFTVSFLIANSTYAFARIATIVLTVVVFLYGLRKLEFNFDYDTGNFNTPAVQFSAVSIISLFQAYLLYYFIAKQIKRARENAAPVVVKTKPKQKLRKREGKDDFILFKSLLLFYVLLLILSMWSVKIYFWD